MMNDEPLGGLRVDDEIVLHAGQTEIAGKLQ
jgi:hypothetical protein